jgi:hypothetical protein
MNVAPSVGAVWQSTQCAVDALEGEATVAEV